MIGSLKETLLSAMALHRLSPTPNSLAIGPSLSDLFPGNTLLLPPLLCYYLKLAPA